MAGRMAASRSPRSTSKFVSPDAEKGVVLVGRGARPNGGVVIVRNAVTSTKKAAK